MLVQMSICRWLYNLICPLPFSYIVNEKTPTIWVESPKLTASYYKEYLGFRIIPLMSSHWKKQILLKKRNNWIWIRPLGIEKHKVMEIKQNQEITIFLSNIESEYNYLSQRVRLVRPIDKLKNKNVSFTVIDCNGIEIVYVCPKIS